MRRTKIVCTIGPASSTARVVRRLVSQVNVFRLNFSHGDRHSHLGYLSTIRREARKTDRTVAILQDLPGPKIRVGKFEQGSADLSRGSRFVLTASDVLGNSRRASINYPDLLDSVKHGDTLHLADGLIRLRVERKDENGDVECTVLAGGTLSSGKGVNAPGVRMKVEYPTEADISYLRFGLEHNIDFVAASFVRTASDLRALRRFFTTNGPSLIAKIEKREAVKNFDEILREADGIMVARGDLGIEVPIQTVPAIQKQIIRKCGQAGKPVIVATQMLVSMVNFPVPTRAEVTDVSTAILDGTDAVMLSDETTVGKYPFESVMMLDKIAKATEKLPDSYARLWAETETTETAEAIGRAACRLADYVGAKAIVAPTQTGSTAKRVAMCRPAQPIVAMCTEGRIARKLNLLRGVVTVVSRKATTVDWLFARADKAAVALGLARRGDRIVVTSGTPGVKGSTNVIRVSVVGGN